MLSRLYEASFQHVVLVHQVIFARQSGDQTGGWQPGRGVCAASTCQEDAIRPLWGQEGPPPWEWGSVSP